MFEIGDGFFVGLVAISLFIVIGRLLGGKAD